MRKIITGIIALSMLLCSATNAYAAAPKVGTLADYTLHTDIVTYINGSPIESYNIKEYTAVAVEDLADYGFSVRWTPDARVLRFYVTDSETKANYAPPKIDIKSIGKRKSPVFYTDIKIVWGDYTQVNAYNIGGRTIVYVDDLADFCGATYEWRPNERRLELEVVQFWSGGVDNAKYDPSAPLDNPCSFTFEKQENGLFIISDGNGDINSINGFGLGCGGVAFSLIRMSNFGSLNITGGVNNIVYGERIEANTPERYNELAKFFRVYINDKLVTGEISRSQGNGHIDYSFIFDKLQSLEKIKTIRVEIGKTE
jgi:hypothetical protein